MHLLDTNILIYYSNGTVPTDFRNEIDNILLSSFRISVITKLEFLGWRGFDSSSFEKAERFIGHAEVFSITDGIAAKTISLRRERGIRLADAIIAATALTQGLTLVTRNQQDFASIPDLSLLNPFSDKML